MMVNGDSEGLLFQSHSHTNTISPLFFSYKVPEYAEMQYNLITSLCFKETKSATMNIFRKKFFSF